MTDAMKLNGVLIDDSFAEAFPMTATAITITAETPEWAMIAAQTATGFATSVIGCGAEGGIDRLLQPHETPDGRPGARILLCAMDAGELQKQVINRVGQCVLTSPGSACFAGLAGDDLQLGSALRRFGDGWQIAKAFMGKRYWRVPVMDGEFLVEDRLGQTNEAVGGGNLLLMGRSFPEVLKASEAAVAAMKRVEDVITPFPGGIVRSGSKVGAKYEGMFASTNQAYCPTLRGAVQSALTPDINCVLEIVIDGLSYDAVARAMYAGLHAAAALGPDNGLLRIGAGNYGGDLGPHHFHLKDML